MNMLPEPSYFYVDPGIGRSNYSLSITPYSDMRWTEAIVKYAVNVPQVIDMTQGKSKCSQCKATYVGYQPTCTAKAIFHKDGKSYYDNRGYHGAYTNFEKECGADLKWDLMEQFNTQKEFFSLLTRIVCLPNLSYDPISKFRDHFPQGVSEVLNTRLIAQDVESLKMQIYPIQDALKMIASKMNAAGAALHFGF